MANELCDKPMLTIMYRSYEVDLNALLNEMAAQASLLGQLEWSAGAPCRVRVGEAALRRIVGNLLENARRYGLDAPIRLELVCLSEKVKIEVLDRGPGIPAKVAAQIFDPFFTTSEYGTGLGLYLAKQMCESSQATLEYVPVAGGGACFRITLSASATLPARPSLSEKA